MYATAGSFTGPLSEAALFFSSSRLIINLKSCISSSGGSVGGVANISVVLALSISLLERNASDSRSLRSFSFIPSFQAWIPSSSPFSALPPRIPAPESLGM